MSARDGVWEAPAHWTICTYARHVVHRDLIPIVEGIEHVPADGPTIVASRHFHHLYDAALLLTAIRRPVHFLVALDWVSNSTQRWAMEAACRWARWPFLLRPDMFERHDGPYRPTDAQRYLRRAMRQSWALLQAGKLLVVFPEGYPNIDPTFTPKTTPDASLPFSSIVARLALRTARLPGRRVAIVPAGLSYESYGDTRVTLRFGQAMYPSADADASDLTERVEAAVVSLCADSHGKQPVSSNRWSVRGGL